MRRDATIGCSCDATAFSEKKALRIYLLVPQLQLDSSGLSHLSVRITQGTRSVKFMCAKLC